MKRKRSSTDGKKRGGPILAWERKDLFLKLSREKEGRFFSCRV